MDGRCLHSSILKVLKSHKYHGSLRIQLSLSLIKLNFPRCTNNREALLTLTEPFTFDYMNNYEEKIDREIS